MPQRPTENLELIKNVIIPQLEAFLSNAKDDSAFTLTGEHYENFQAIRARFARRVRRYNHEIELIDGIDFSASAGRGEIESLLKAANTYIAARAMYARQTAKATATIGDLLSTEEGGKIREARAKNAAKARKLFDEDKVKRYSRARAGGEARKEALKPAMRQKIAKNAALARWKKPVDEPED